MKNYTVKNGPDIYSLALLVYGSLENVVKLCNDNGLTLSSTIKPGTVIVYDPTLVRPITPVQVKQVPQPAPAKTLTFKSIYGQNQYDIALNTYGSIENYIQMLLDNGTDHDYIPQGKEYVFTTHLVKDVNVYNETTARGVIFSTGIPGLTGETAGDFNSDFSGDFSGG